MASEWAEEAERQAKSITRDLLEVGKAHGFRVTYQKQEARFSLRAGPRTHYFSAKAYERDHGMDWLRLRIDVLSAAQPGVAPSEASAQGA